MDEDRENERTCLQKGVEGDMSLGKMKPVVGVLCFPWTIPLGLASSIRIPCSAVSLFIIIRRAVLGGLHTRIC